MTKQIWNEGRVVGYSAYEEYVKQHLAQDIENPPASELEWLSSSIAMGSSLLLKVPEVTPDSSGYSYVNISLPKDSRLGAANTILASFFSGDGNFEEDDPWATRVIDYGNLISNTASTHPEGPLDDDETKGIAKKEFLEYDEENKERLFNYMKIIDGIVLQPGTWETSENNPPYSDEINQKIDGCPVVRLSIRGKIENGEDKDYQPRILLTGFTLKSVLSGVTSFDGSTNETSPEDGDYLGPAIYPWANKIVFITPNSYSAYTDMMNSADFGNQEDLATRFIANGKSVKCLSVSPMVEDGSDPEVYESDGEDGQETTEGKGGFNWNNLASALKNNKFVNVLYQALKIRKHNNNSEKYLTMNPDTQGTGKPKKYEYDNLKKTGIGYRYYYGTYNNKYYVLESYIIDPHEGQARTDNATIYSWAGSSWNVEDERKFHENSEGQITQDIPYQDSELSQEIEDEMKSQDKTYDQLPEYAGDIVTGPYTLDNTRPFLNESISAGFGIKKTKSEVILDDVDKGEYVQTTLESNLSAGSGIIIEPDPQDPNIMMIRNSAPYTPGGLSYSTIPESYYTITLNNNFTGVKTKISGQTLRQKIEEYSKNTSWDTIWSDTFMSSSDYKKSMSVGLNGSNLIKIQSGANKDKYYGTLAVRILTATNDGTNVIRLANGGLAWMNGGGNFKFRHTVRTSSAYRDSSIFTIKFKKELLPLNNITSVQNDTGSNNIWNIIQAYTGNTKWTTKDPGGSYAPNFSIQPPKQPSGSIDGYPFEGSYNIYGHSIPDGFNDQYSRWLNKTDNLIFDDPKDNRVVGSYLNLTIRFYVNIPKSEPIDWDEIKRNL